MSGIVIVDGTYALVRGDVVVGVVTKCNDTQWQFRPIVAGCGGEDAMFYPLHDALKAALKFKPKGDAEQ